MSRMKCSQIGKPNGNFESFGRRMALGHVLRFAGHTEIERPVNVRPVIETFPLAKAAEAYQHMMSGKARFRVVLTP